MNSHLESQRLLFVSCQQILYNCPSASCKSVANWVCTDVDISRRQAITVFRLQSAAVDMSVNYNIHVFYHSFVFVVWCSVMFLLSLFLIFNWSIDSMSDCGAPNFPFYRFLYTYSLHKISKEYNIKMTWRKVSELAKAQRRSSEFTNKANYL
jgi:hypothetical protein